MKLFVILLIFSFLLKIFSTSIKRSSFKVKEEDVFRTNNNKVINNNKQQRNKNLQNITLTNGNDLYKFLIIDFLIYNNSENNRDVYSDYFNFEETNFSFKPNFSIFKTHIETIKNKRGEECADLISRILYHKITNDRKINLYLTYNTCATFKIVCSNRTNLAGFNCTESINKYIVSDFKDIILDDFSLNALDVYNTDCFYKETNNTLLINLKEEKDIVDLFKSFSLFKEDFRKDKLKSLNDKMILTKLKELSILMVNSLLTNNDNFKIYKNELVNLITFTLQYIYDSNKLYNNNNKNATGLFKFFLFKIAKFLNALTVNRNKYNEYSIFKQFDTFKVKLTFILFLDFS